MTKRILTFFLAVLMLVGSVVPVFAEEADVVVHEPVMADSVDLGKREMVNDDALDETSKAETDKPVAEEVEAKDAQVTIKFVDLKGNKIGKPMVKEYTLGEEKTIKAPDIKGYTKKDDTKSFTVTEGLEVEFVYEKVETDEPVVNDAKTEQDELEVADVEVDGPVGAEEADASLFTFDGNTVTGWSEKGQEYLNEFWEKGENPDLIIPSVNDKSEPVTEIGAWAFSSFIYKSVVIPEGITTIGEGVFSGNQLKEVVIPDSVTSIGNSAFSNNQLTEMTIGNGVTTIGEGAFSGNQLKEVVIPDSVTSIGNSAFSGNKLKYVSIPQAVDKISDYAFQGNQLTGVLIPDSVTSIGNGAFENNQLTEVTIPDNVTSIGHDAFSGNQLASVTIGNNVTVIGDGAFSNNQLTELDISASLESIGPEAFSQNPGSDKYSGFVVLHGPKGVEKHLPSKENYLVNPEDPIVGEELNEEDFEYKKLDDGTWEISGITTKGVNKLRGNGMKLTLPVTYKGEAITSVASEAFVRKQIRDLVIPEGYIKIGDSAFASNKITNLFLPKSLVSIGNWAFGSNQLTKLNLSNSKDLTTLGSSAFQNNKIEDVDLSACSNLENISYSVFQYNPVKKLNASGAESLKEIEHDALSGAQLEELNLSGCKSLAGNSLYELGNLINLKILDLSGCENLKEIPKNIFKEAQLEKVDLSGCTSLESIGDHAFFKNNIKDLNLEGLTSLKKIEAYAFAHNDIDKLNISESVTEVGAYAFRDNLIKELDTKNVVSLGEGAFSDNRLEKLVFGDALTSIGSHAFEQNALIEVEIGENVKSIGESAFAFNGRYVKINTENEIVKNEKTYRGYGHVVNPVKITVKYINAETGESILDDKVLGDDLTDINAVFNIGEENTFVPEKIKGYWIKDEVKFTPDSTDYTLILKYTPTNKKPTIEGANIRMIAKDEVIGEKELLGFIKATDLTGKDITDKVTVSPKTLDTSTGGVKKVTYAVTDEFGNSSVVDIELPVAIDWNNYPIGNGWVLGDFTYSGNTVTGFSEQGKEKVKTNKALVVPGFVPKDGVLNVNELEKVTGIGDTAFSDNQLTSVVIPDSVTSIGNDAFRSNQLRSVVVPDSVKTISKGAFFDNLLATVHIGDGVTEIGTSAFQGYDGDYGPNPYARKGKNPGNQIKELYIGKSVTSIGNGAFENNQLTEVVIPDSVTSIGSSAFAKNHLTEVVIPDSVTSIGDSAFRSNQLRSVVVPDSVKSIGNGAFYNNQLTSVVIPDSVKSIGHGAFYNNQLTSVVIPDSVKSIGNGAFENNQLTSVVIPDSVTSIGDSAFMGNPIEKLKLKSDAAYIITQKRTPWGEYITISRLGDVFNYKNIKELEISEGSKTIKNTAFSDWKLNKVTIPDSVKSIGARAFANNQLTSVVIPDSVTSIEKWAFYNNQLTSVVIPDSVTSIGNDAFKSNQLTSVVIPDSVTSIGNGAFFDNLLEKAYIGDGVVEIGQSAFQGYASGWSSNIYINVGKNPGNQIKELYIGKSVTSIGLDAFMCNPIEKLKLKSDAVYIDNLTKIFNHKNIKELEISDSSKTVPINAFRDWNLNKVLIPDSVTSIGADAFSGNQLTELVIPDSVTDIGADAFSGNQLTEVVIPDSVTSIGNYAFRDNPGDPDYDNFVVLWGPKGVEDKIPSRENYIINPDKKVNSTDFVPEDLMYKLLDNDTYEIIGLSRTGLEKTRGNGFKLILNFNEYKEKKITSIGHGAFRDNQLTSVVIPDSVTSIGNYAFRDNQLTSVVIPDSVTSIGDSAFRDNPIEKLKLKSDAAYLTYANIKNTIDYKNIKELEISEGSKTINNTAFSGWKLNKVTIPDSVTSIGYEVFKNNQLTSVVIPDSVTSIGNYAFRGNQLTSVVIPDSVTSIGHGAFRDNQLTSVVIPDSVTSIGNGAFENNQLTSVVIPDSVTSIGHGAFRDNQLTSVVIPDSVTSIGNDAFENNQLTSVVIPDSVTSIGHGAFRDNQLTSVVIPDSVTSIWYEVFKNNQLTSVVIPNSVTIIGGSAFRDNQLTSVVIPDSVTSIGGSAFRDNPGMDKNRNVYLFTPDRTNPNNLKSVSGEYLINPTELHIKFLDEDGNVVSDEKNFVPSAGTEIKMPVVVGYAPYYKDEKLVDGVKVFNPEPGATEVFWDIVYKKEDPAESAKIDLTTSLVTSNEGTNTYQVAESQRYNIHFTVLGDIANIENAKIKIQLPDCLDKDSIKIPRHPFIKDWNIDGNILTINLQNITLNTSMEIPMLFKSIKYKTPRDTDYTLRTAIYSSDDKQVSKVMEDDFNYKYKSPTLILRADDIRGTGNDNYKNMGEIEYLDKEKTKAKVLGDNEIKYYWRLEGLDRDLSSYRLEVELPKYIAYDEKGNEVEKYAELSDKNTDWKILDGKLVYELKDLSGHDFKMPSLYLKYPGIKNQEKVELKSFIKMYQYKMGYGEVAMDSMADLAIRLYGEEYKIAKPVVPDPGPGPVVEWNYAYLRMSSRVRYEYGIGDYIFDYSVDRESIVAWQIAMLRNRSTASYKNFNLVFTDEDLDARYRYHSVRNTGGEDFYVRLYVGDEVVDEYLLERGALSKEFAKNITKIEFYTKEGKLYKGNINFDLNTILKNPKMHLTENEVISEVQLKGLGYADVENGDKTFTHSKLVGDRKYSVKPFDYRMRAFIELYNMKKELAAGDLVNYKVGIKDVINGKDYSNEFFNLGLKNFRQVVVLPQNSQVKNVALSKGFKNSPKSRYSFVDLGNGYQAIVFETEELKEKTNEIAKIELMTTEEMRDGKHLTETYATWDSEDIGKYNISEIPEIIKDQISGVVTKGQVDYFLASVKGVFSRKYIKLQNGTYGLSTESLDGNVDYQLKVYNNADVPRTNVEIVDILPYIGDDRGSEINVTLREPVNLPGAKISYTTEKKPTTESNFTEGFREGITAVKIQVPKIDANNTLAINVPAKFKNPEEFKDMKDLAGKLAINDFVRKDDLTKTWVKTLAVVTKYRMPNADIEFTKYGLKKSIFFNSYKKVPLPGAEFELRDVDGNYIESAVSDAEGKVVFTNVGATDYIIKEVKAPEGYTIGDDIPVKVDDYKLVDGKIKAVLDDGVINEAVRYGNLTIKKTTGTGKDLSGIEFTVKGADPENASFEKVVKTNAYGEIKINRLPEGNYKVEETNSKNFLPAEGQSFRVSNTEGDQIDGDQEIKLNFTNDKVQVRLNKVGILATDKMPNDFTKVSSKGKKALAGVSFNIDGKDYTTNKDGYLEFEAKTNTVINIKETSSPDGYKANNVDFNIKIQDDGTITNEAGEKYIYDEINVPNQAQFIFKLNKVSYKSNERLPETFNNVSSSGRTLIPNVKFNINGKEYTTDKNGNITIPVDTGSTLVIEEISSPEGYKKNPVKFTVKITEDGKIVDEAGKPFVYNEVNVPNQEKFMFKLNKVSYSSSEVLPEAFNNVSSGGRKLIADVKFNINGKEYTTDKNGNITIPVDTGSTLVIEEISSPEGYKKNPVKFTVKITEDGQIVDEAGKPFIYNEVNVPNQEKFNFKLNKVGYNNNEDLPQDLTNINLFNRGFVAGATFKINGEEYTTDKNGNITVPIDTGATITVEEVKAPNGYILNDRKLTLKLTDDGKLLNLEGKPYNGNMLYFPNKLKEVKGKIIINKVDPDGKSLEGAKFALYKVEGMKESLVGEYTSNNNGKVNINNLKPGTYKLIEVAAPDGYYHDKWEKIITIPETPKDLEAKTEEEAVTLRANDSYDFYTTDDTSFTREIGYKVVNKKLNVTAYKYEKVLSNVDEKDIDQYNNKAGYKVIKSGDKYSVVKAIPNVKFNFYEGDTLIDTLVSGKDGYVDFKGYVFNENKDYKLVEIEAPEEYKVNKAPIRISISKLKALDNFDGNVDLEIENKPIKGKIVISKYDATTRLVLPGQEFTLYDSDGKKIVSKVTNEAGLIEFGDLDLKTYTFKETKVSGNYRLDPKEYKASLSLLKLIHVEKVFNEPGTKNVEVYKVDQYDNPVDGASFGIFKDGKMLYGPVKTENGGQAYFENVKNEEGLELREVSAAEGYRLNTKSIKIDMSQPTIWIKVTNYEIEQLLPDTGTRGLIPYILAAVALIGIGYTVSRKKKQK